ncbi:MAG: YkgJ family cysteine cluster protein [Desulfohalobiaceae bacterium]|nr:YkgJ family cysteine cluster protein [Desulfohalobiaceae bacterium]
MPEHEAAFTCKRCGNCCQGQGGIVLTGRDEDRLSAFLGLCVSVFRTRYTEKYGKKRVLATKTGNVCIFFEAKSGCTVHPNKPDICRSWPFFRGNLLDELSWLMAQDSCPGINPGVGHREFVCQGLCFLQKQGLQQQPGARTPAALVVADLYQKLT